MSTKCRFVVFILLFGDFVGNGHPTVKKPADYCSLNANFTASPVKIIAYDRCIPLIAFGELS